MLLKDFDLAARVLQPLLDGLPLPLVFLFPELLPEPPHVLLQHGQGVEQVFLVSQEQSVVLRQLLLKT